jgi:hypothetical protein
MPDAPVASASAAGSGVSAAPSAAALRRSSGATASAAPVAPAAAAPASAAAPPRASSTAATKNSWAAVLTATARPPPAAAAAATRAPPSAFARIASFQHVSARKPLSRANVLFKLLTGHYMVELYLTSHENIKAAFSTLGVVSTLLLAVGLTLFLAPLQGDKWGDMVKTQYALAICSGWAMLNNLLAILLCLAVLSLVSHIPEERGVLAAFVQAHRGFFTAPIMLAGSSVCVLVMAFVACAYAMYGPYVALLGFSSVLFWLMWLLTVTLRMLNTVWHHDYDYGDDVAEGAGESEAAADAAAVERKGGAAAAAAAGNVEGRRRRRGAEGGGGERRGGGDTAASAGGGGGTDDDAAAQTRAELRRAARSGRGRRGGDKIGDTPLLPGAAAAADATRRGDERV